MANKINISLIAKKAGVSPATVSRVLNHRDLVKDSTVKKIENVIQELNYVVSASKASGSEKKLIIINVMLLTNPFYAEVLEGIIASAESHEYHTLISHHTLNTKESVNNFISLVKNINAAGVILLTSLEPDYYNLINVFVPIVQCCEYSTERLSYVSIDDYRASYKVMEHIYSTGHRKIALLNGPLTYKYAKERRRSYENFLQSAGLPVQNNWIIQLPELNYDMAFSAVSQLLTSINPPDAIFAVSDLMACAVIKAAKMHNIKIPEDLVVVGFDNIYLSTISDPTITTVSQPRFQLGYTACEMLNEQINNPSTKAQHALLETELIIRESSSRNQ